MEQNLDISLGEMTAAAEEAASMMRLMSNPSRLLLLCHLVEGERTVGELENLTELGQAYVSQQLARLRSEGLVDGTRDGRLVRYRLTDERVIPVLEALYRAFCVGSMRA